MLLVYLSLILLLCYILNYFSAYSLNLGLTIIPDGRTSDESFCLEGEMNEFFYPQIQHSQLKNKYRKTQ